MTFYLKPPRGRIELEKMVDCLQQRLYFITSILEHDDSFRTPQSLEYFVEGTAIDRTSHYMLRLVSLEPQTFQNFILNAETALFQKRLECLTNTEDIQSILQTCRQQCTDLILTRNGFLHTKYLIFLKSVENMCCDILRKPGGITHAFHYAHRESCKSVFVRVPFRICLGLIATRKVHLLNGEAIVPCGVWRLLLIDVFRQHLLLGYEDMELSGCGAEALKDSRVVQLAEQMRLIFSGMHQHGNTNTEYTLSRAKLAEAERQQMLPPCTMSMLSTLHAQHRVGHHARIALTLILKEAGMPLNEALNFWKHELSQPLCREHGTQLASCAHSWQTDEKKFTYSLRHLYGLEGAKKNYSAPCCRTLQSQLLAPGALGGCPFVRLPEDKLLPLLTGLTLESIAEIKNLVHEDKPLQACRQLLMNRIKHNMTDDVNQQNTSIPPMFSKPTQFYAICRNWTEEF